MSTAGFGRGTTLSDGTHVIVIEVGQELEEAEHHHALHNVLHRVQEHDAVAQERGGLGAGVLVLDRSDGVTAVGGPPGAVDQVVDLILRHRAEGGHAIEDTIDSVLLTIDSTFLIDLCVAVKSGCNLLTDRCLGKQITGKLFNCKLIERHPLIQRIDNPFAITPNRTGRIHGVTVTVGVPGLV